MSVRILIGDMRERLRELPDDSVDSCVCDPPYHLTSIVKRFGAANASPAKVGKTGAYARASKGFMGQTWDGGDVAFDPATWAEVLRVLKPGAHLVAFSGTRTYHRMVCAIEDAGFEIRDQLAWCYGSGFPKSHDVSKGIDRMAGAEREVIGVNPASRANAKTHNVVARGKFSGEATVTAPATDAAKQWQGWGTALKPAWEPICLARKPLVGTVAANVLRFGTGAINVDACRISASNSEAEPGGARTHKVRGLPNPVSKTEIASCASETADDVRRRLPLHDHEGGEQPELGGRGLDGPSVGLSPSERRPALSDRQGTTANPGTARVFGAPASNGPSDRATASDFGTRPPHQRDKGRQPSGKLGSDGLGGTFERSPADGTSAVEAGSREPEAQRADRQNSGLGRWPANIIHDGSEEVLAGFPDVTTHGGGASSTGFWSPNDTTRPIGPGDSGSAARFFYCAKATTAERGEGNNHPTVKPVDLMRWLCRLVTPKGGTVLDPFMGSGSTMIAADAEQFNGIGCELSPEYASIAETRIRAAAGMFAEVLAA